METSSAAIATPSMEEEADTSTAADAGRQSRFRCR